MAPLINVTLWDSTNVAGTPLMVTQDWLDLQITMLMVFYLLPVLEFPKVSADMESAALQDKNLPLITIYGITHSGQSTYCSNTGLG